MPSGAVGWPECGSVLVGPPRHVVSRIEGLCREGKHQDNRLGARVGLDRLGSRARIGMIGFAMAVLSACTPIYQKHGYVPRDEDLAKIVVGESSTEDVGLVLGRPSVIGVLSGSGWYYVGSRFKQVGIRAPKEIDRQVVAVSFDEQGMVENVERFGLENGQVVALSRRVTDSNVKGVSFLRQLLGNLGNLSAADFLRDN
jgi:outer membrane protein assembly factor BamE (lipoprotein component of BamABCDE complex)